MQTPINGYMTKRTKRQMKNWLYDARQARKLRLGYIKLKRKELESPNYMDHEHTALCEQLKRGVVNTETR